jgi:hypothetical protein
MGHPRRISKKYSAPKHPWRAERIQEEKGIGKTYGLKNKKEIWKAHAYLRAIRQQARTLLAKKTPQSNVEKTQLIRPACSTRFDEARRGNRRYFGSYNNGHLEQEASNTCAQAWAGINHKPGPTVCTSLGWHQP